MKKRYRYPLASIVTSSSYYIQNNSVVESLLPFLTIHTFENSCKICLHTYHIYQTTTVPLTLYVPTVPKPLSKEGSFYAGEQYLYRIYMLQPHSTYYIPENVKYCIVTQDKTFFAVYVTLTKPAGSIPYNNPLATVNAAEPTVNPEPAMEPELQPPTVNHEPAMNPELQPPTVMDLQLNPKPQPETAMDLQLNPKPQPETAMDLRVNPNPQPETAMDLRVNPKPQPESIVKRVTLTSVGNRRMKEYGDPRANWTKGKEDCDVKALDLSAKIDINWFEKLVMDLEY